MATKKKTGTAADKQVRVEAEEMRLRGIFAKIDKNVMELMGDLIQNTAYITVSIKDLQSLINKEGYTEKYDNGGGQKGKKESTHVKLHKDYSRLQRENLKALANYVPPAEKANTLRAAMREAC